MIRIKVTRIDGDGYCGRDPHPPLDLFGPAELLRIEPDAGDPELLIYTVRMEADGAVFQLVEHEFDVLASGGEDWLKQWLIGLVRRAGGWPATGSRRAAAGPPARGSR